MVTIVRIMLLGITCRCTMVVCVSPLVEKYLVGVNYTECVSKCITIYPFCHQALLQPDRDCVLYIELLTWYQVAGISNYVTVGPSGVYKTQSNSQVHYLGGSRSIIQPTNPTWFRLQGRLFQISYGSDMAVGVTAGRAVYGFSEIESYDPDWLRFPGSLVLAIVSEHVSQVWGITETGDLVYKNGVNYSMPLGTTDWIPQGSGCISVSISKYGIWVVETNNTLSFRPHNLTTSSSDLTGVGFQQVDGLMKQLSAEGSEMWIVAVNPYGALYVRLGVTESSPTGTSWKPIDFVHGPINQVTVYKDQLWLTTMDGKIYTRKLNLLWLA